MRIYIVLQIVSGASEWPVNASCSQLVVPLACQGCLIPLSLRQCVIYGLFPSTVIPFRITLPGLVSSAFLDRLKIEVGLVNGLFWEQLHTLFGRSTCFALWKFFTGRNCLLIRFSAWKSLGASGSFHDMPEILGRQVTVRNGKGCPLWHLHPSLWKKILSAF